MRPQDLRDRMVGRMLTIAPPVGAWSSSKPRAQTSGSLHPVAHSSLGLPPSRPPPRLSRPDIRPAHGVLWADPTHARMLVRVPAPLQVAASSAINFGHFSPPPRAASLPPARGGAQKKTEKGRAIRSGRPSSALQAKPVPDRCVAIKHPFLRRASAKVSGALSSLAISKSLS